MICDFQTPLLGCETEVCLLVQNVGTFQSMDRMTWQQYCQYKHLKGRLWPFLGHKVKGETLFRLKERNGKQVKGL